MVAIQETIKGSNLSPEEYLTQEEKALTKHEYINGEVYEMAGASSAHVTISLNVASLLKAHLKGSNCRVFISDMKVRIDRLNVFYYPDVIVTCNEKDRELNYYKKHHKLSLKFYQKVQNLLIEAINLLTIAP